MRRRRRRKKMIMLKRRMLLMRKWKIYLVKTRMNSKTLIEKWKWKVMDMKLIII